jgi:hypothetical protein
MEFDYCTIKMLRDEGLTVTELPDSRARDLIRLAGRMINRITDQWFAPVVGRFKVDGRGTPFAHLDNLIPIPLLNTVETGGVGGEDFEVVDADDYVHERGKRIVEMIGATARFPRTPLGVTLDGAFAWLEDLKDVTTAVTAPVASGATDVPVASTTGFRVGDQVIFGNEAVMVSEIPSPILLKFDPLEFAIASGATARTLGRTPLEIRRACILIVNDRLAKISEDDAAIIEQDIQSRIVSESIEGYSYSLAAPSDEKKAGTESGGGQNTSGNAAADDLLSGFVTPVLYLGYV